MMLRRNPYAQLAQMFLPADAGGGGGSMFGSKRSAGQPQKFPNTTACPPGMVKTGGGQEHTPVAFIGDKPWKPYVMCEPAPAAAPAPRPPAAQVQVEVSPTFQQQFTPSISPVFQQIEDSPGAAVGATTTQAGAGSQEAAPPDRTTMPVTQPPGVSSQELLAILAERDDRRRREEAEARARRQSELDASAAAERQRREDAERRRREEDERARAEFEEGARAEMEDLRRAAAAEPTVTIQPAGPAPFFAPTPATFDAEVMEGELLEEPGLPIGVVLVGVVALGGALYFMQRRRKR